MLQSIFQKYTGLLRSLKAVYVLNNLLHWKSLKHNAALYHKYGLKKMVISPIGSADFQGQHSPDIPLVDRPNALEILAQLPDFQNLDLAMQEKVRHFVQHGFMVLEHYFSMEKTDALNAAVEQSLNNGTAGYNYTGRKIFNLWESSQLAKEQFFEEPGLIRLLSMLLGKPVIPFQTLNFTLGSEQRAHSDAIHMTTEPPGYLIATWIALEDCTEDNGPLFYYPGSHRLDYVTTEHYDSGNTAFTIGSDSNKRYEDKIAELIEKQGLEPKLFLAKRGDVLIWHANLLHGGSPIRKPGATRKSMVCHYFAEGVICYHEMTQRPAILKM